MTDQQHYILIQNNLYEDVIAGRKPAPLCYTCGAPSTYVTTGVTPAGYHAWQCDQHPQSATPLWGSDPGWSSEYERIADVILRSRQQNLERAQKDHVFEGTKVTHPRQLEGRTPQEIQDIKDRLVHEVQQDLTPYLPGIQWDRYEVFVALVLGVDTHRDIVHAWVVFKNKESGVGIGVNDVTYTDAGELIDRGLTSLT
jgi:hypothetical protein